MTGQFGLSPHDHPPLLRALASFACPRSNQFPLELGKPAQERDLLNLLGTIAEKGAGFKSPDNSAAPNRTRSEIADLTIDRQKATFVGIDASGEGTVAREVKAGRVVRPRAQ